MFREHIASLCYLLTFTGDYVRKKGVINGPDFFILTLLGYAASPLSNTMIYDRDEQEGKKATL